MSVLLELEVRKKDAFLLTTLSESLWMACYLYSDEITNSKVMLRRKRHLTELLFL
jgi:hypothetical protein